MFPGDTAREPPQAHTRGGHLRGGTHPSKDKCGGSYCATHQEAINLVSSENDRQQTPVRKQGCWSSPQNVHMYAQAHQSMYVLGTPTYTHPRVDKISLIFPKQHHLDA